MASLYACLGYKRKEVYILREVLGCLLDLMVCGREEDGYSHPSSVPVSAGLGIHNYHPGGWETVGVRVSESAAGNDSILKLLTHVCRVLGIDLEAVTLEKVDHSNLVDRPPSLNDYDEDTIEALREPCGWPELQVGVVREAVAVAEALPGARVVLKLKGSYGSNLATSRFSCRRSICAFCAEDVAGCSITRRPVSSIFYRNTSTYDCP
jgi:hypothetical protein